MQVPERRRTLGYTMPFDPSKQKFVRQRLRGAIALRNRIGLKAVLLFRSIESMELA